MENIQINMCDHKTNRLISSRCSSHTFCLLSMLNVTQFIFGASGTLIGFRIFKHRLLKFWPGNLAWGKIIRVPKLLLSDLNVVFEPWRSLNRDLYYCPDWCTPPPPKPWDDIMAETFLWLEMHQWNVFSLRNPKFNFAPLTRMLTQRKQITSSLQKGTRPTVAFSMV